MSATPYAQWYKMGGYGIAATIGLSILLGEEGSEIISGIACCFSIFSFIVGGIIHSSVASQAATVALSGVAGASGAAMAQTEKGQQMAVVAEQRMNDFSANATEAWQNRSNANDMTEVDSNALFNKLAGFMAEQGFTPGMMFTKMDLDGNDVLDPFELREGISNLGVADIPPWLMGSLIKVIDENGNEKIDRREWMALFEKMGWDAPEPTLTILSISSDLITISFTAPPWPATRGSWIGLYGPLERNYSDNDPYEVHPVNGQTSGTVEFKIYDEGEWKVRMYDSSESNSMEVAMVSTHSSSQSDILAQVENSETTHMSENDVEIQEEKDPLDVLISLIPQEHQQIAQQTVDNLQTQISNSTDAEEKAELQGMLIGLIDDFAHQLPPESWTAIAAGSAAAVGAGIVIAAKKNDDSMANIVDENEVPDEVAEILSAVPDENENDGTSGLLEDGESEVPDEIAEILSAVPDESEVPDENDSTSGLLEDDDSEAIALDSSSEDETHSGPSIDDLFAEVEAAKFMSLRQEILTTWNQPMPVEIRVEKVERNIGFDIKAELKGGMGIIGRNDAGHHISIRLPPSHNDEVGEIRIGAKVSASGVPNAYSSATKLIGFDAEIFTLISN
ncbi:MAG TPA: hypothetical protein EYG04_02950 [Candidatus Poseidoniales archaeon]|nr:hypothetical protein [Candidatus Poseidoniales archaeon]